MRATFGLKRGFTALAGAALLLGACWPSRAAATEAEVVDRHPLRPADTSSPRDTLRSFLKNVDVSLLAWQQNAYTYENDRAFLSAVAALDFSATPEGDAWSVQTDRVLLLKEILERVPLPPDAKIPGDAEVARGGVARWTVPDTPITIVRIEIGPRAGEFLFSSDTVERLARSYAMVKDLPYRRAVPVPRAYEAYAASDRGIGAFERQLRSRVQRVDTSSPRSTLKAFLDNVNEAWTLVRSADARLKARPPALSREEAIQIEKAADDHLRRAAATLDLSRIPEAHRRTAGIEAVLKLKEILDRTLLPNLEYVPDSAMVAAEASRGADRPSTRSGRPLRWRYPSTSIEIVGIDEGDRQGEFLFSARSVAEIDKAYDRVRSLPYRTQIRVGGGAKFSWSEVSDGFYEQFVTSPGFLVRRLSILGGVVDALPAWSRAMLAGLVIWQWIGLLLCFAAVIVSARLVFRATRGLARRLDPPMDGWLRALAPVLVLLVLAAANYVIGEDLHVTGPARAAVTTAGNVVRLVLVMWAIIALFGALAETVIASPKIQDKSLDAGLLRMVMRISAFAIGGWIVIVSLRDLGTDPLPLLTGLGVGGLAVALAAQRTFANFIGSLILFANKTVKPGDFCRYGDQVGTVESIGWLSTRIRSLERTIVTVPNAEFSEMKVDNYAQRDRRLLKAVLQLRYETTAEQLRYILAKLRELLLGHPKVTPDPARVRLVGYGASSIDVEVFAYLRCQDQDTFLAIQEDVLLRIRDVVEQAGSGFAFPSQTAYLLRGKGLDAERGKKAEAEVERWRSAGRLPFPEFEATERERIAGTLDFPPRGSPGYEGSRARPDRQPATGGSALSGSDLVNLAAFVKKLQEPSQISQYLWGRLGVKTQGLLSRLGAESEADAREALVRDLNEIIGGPSIFAVDRFSEIKRRQETQELLDREPTGEDLARLNRLLLEEAYPEELSRKIEAVASAGAA